MQRNILESLHRLKRCTDLLDEDWWKEKRCGNGIDEEEMKEGWMRRRSWKTGRDCWRDFGLGLEGKRGNGWKRKEERLAKGKRIGSDEVVVFYGIERREGLAHETPSNRESS